jgi:hypothetical protein
MIFESWDDGLSSKQSACTFTSSYHSNLKKCISKVTICNVLSKNRSNVTPLAFNSHKMCYHRIYKHFLKFKARPVPSKNVTSPIGQAAILLGCDRFFQGLF